MSAFRRDAASSLAHRSTDTLQESKVRTCYGKCPYRYEVKDGRMIVGGEDRGDVVEYMAKARKLRGFYKLCHAVSVAS